MYYIFFIHPSVDGHLGCFHVLAIVNLIVVCISLIISDVVHLFMCFWPSVCLLWRNVYLDLLPTFFFFNFYFFMAVLGLRFHARAFSSCGKRGPLLIMVRGPLTIAASLVAEHRLQTRRLSSCGSRAQSLHSTWYPPRPGLEPMSPARAGRLPTTAPLGKPLAHFLIGLFAFLILSHMSCLYILEINLLLVASFANIFFHSVSCLFSFFFLWFPLLCKSFSV